MNTFSEHKFTKNSDGTFNILEVPIFELGSHKKFNYDEKWMQDALGNFYELRKKKFLPRVIVGHTSEGSEKPAVGFLDNLKMIGKRIYADMVNLSEKTFEEIKSRAWPGRSVEVNPNKRKFTALALLGGTEPYFQFEPITDVKFEADPDGSWIEFQDDPFDTLRDQKNLILQMWNKLLEVFKSTNNEEESSKMTAEEKKTLVAEVKADLQKEFQDEFNKKYVERFKEEHGVTPEEFKKRNEEREKAAFSEKKKVVVSALKKKLAPVLVDRFLVPMIDFAEGLEGDTIKFGEDEKGNIFEFVQKFGEKLAELAEKKSLVVDFDEHARFAGEDGNPNLKGSKLDIVDMSEKEAAELDKKIEKFRKDNKIASYEEAAERYYAEMN